MTTLETAPGARLRPLAGTADGAALLRLVVSIALGFIIVMPLVAIVTMSTRADFGELVSDPDLLQATVNSLASSAGSALAATALGAGFALVLERYVFPGANLARWFLLIPFLIPPFIGAMSWMALLGVNGPVNSAFRALGVESELSIFGGWGVTFLLTVHSYPMAFVVISTALSRVPGNLEEAARLSGASPARVLSTVTLPLIRPGLIAAFILTFVSNLSDFGIPALVGLPARYTTLTTLVYRQLSSPTQTNPLPAVSGIALLLMVLAIGAILLQRKIQGATQMAAGKAALKSQLGKAKYPVMGVLWAWILVICVFPLLALTAQALLPAPGIPLTFETVTFDNITKAITSRGALRGIQNSVFLAGTAAIVCGVLGLALGILLTRTQSKLNPVLDVLATLPQALPGLVIAVGWLLVAPSIGLFNSPWLIICAYIMAFIALVVQQLRAPLSSISRSLEEAAQAAGASRTRSMLEITGRIVAPAAITGAVVVFLTAVRELTISILLVSPGSQTLGVTIFNLQQAGNYTAAAALALVVALVGIVGLSLTAFFTNKQARA